MTDKTEAQPEALRLAEAQRYSEVVHHANVKASLAYVARKSGLGYQETERLLELALQRGDLAEGDYAGRKMENAANDQLASLEAQLVTQTNRAAAAEQQVTALTQRLDMANRLNIDARNRLADMGNPITQCSQQVAQCQSTAGGQWKCGDEFLPCHPDASHVDPAYRDGWNDCYRAAPPPPEREPLSQEYARKLVWSASTWSRSEGVSEDDVLEVIAAVERAQGIGATND